MNKDKLDQLSKKIDKLESSKKKSQIIHAIQTQWQKLALTSSLSDTLFKVGEFMHLDWKSAFSLSNKSF